MSLTLGQPRHWSSPSYFVLVTVAALINLSCFWRLPALTMHYGGSAFIAVYAFAMLVFGLPLFAGQIYLARGTNLDLPGVVSRAGRAMRGHRLWLGLAWIGVAGAALVFVLYLIVASWSLAFAARALGGMLDTGSMQAASDYFAAFIQHSARGFGWLLVLACLLVAVAARGLKKGIEPVTRTLAVVLLIGLVGLFVCALEYGPGGHLLGSLVAFDWRALSFDAVVQAFYQAFFSLGLGTGIVIVFGSYLAPRTSCIRLSALVVGLQLVIGILAAAVAVLVLGPAVGDPSTGLLTLFAAIPATHGNGPITIIFFIVLALAAITTATALFEPLVQLAERRVDWSRAHASVVTGTGLALLAVVGVLSFGPLADWRIADESLFAGATTLTAGWLLPLTALLLCGVTIHVLKTPRLESGLGVELSPRLRSIWLGALRYSARIALIVVAAYATGALSLARAFWSW